ncbi:hypothetical protein GCM10010282_67290 [Streptomyces roseolus]|nr:hypothetical protein GCM10010282_67290 [Streptomyces roseolus]
MRALMYAGIGLCAAGAVALVAGAVIDIEAADPWASVGGGAAGLLGIALALYAHFASSASPGGMVVSAAGERSIAAGGSIGSAVTGDGATPAPAPAMPPTRHPATGGVTAVGGRSVAAGGDIGSVSTGDG